VKDCELIKFALLNGYRMIDTAYFYQNEDVVGKAVNEGKKNFCSNIFEKI
jgi:diketogulonate reductase-like aldo/keto reductase